MNKNDAELKDQAKPAANESLKDEDLKEVTGGFNPQPDPPGRS